MTGLRGRVAIVTGGVGYLGNAIVHRLLDAGAVVGVTSRDADRLHHWLESKGRRDNPGIVGLRMELTDAESRRAAVEELSSMAGVPSILIGNASFRDGLARPFDQFDPHDVCDLLNVDVSGHLSLAQEIVKQPDRPPASIVFVSSIYGVVGVDHGIYPPDMSATPVQYVAAKAAVLGITRYLAARWGRDAVRVNSVVAGGIRNPGKQSGEFVRNYASKTMLGRMAEPDEVAAAVAFLASDDAAYITGHHLVVDGGYSAW